MVCKRSHVTIASSSSSTSSPGKRKRTTFKNHNKYRGVVSQQKGKWGAQIYAKRNRYWLGTFNSEEDAARAYDIASIKLHPDSSRNLPPTSNPADEMKFQTRFTDEEVLGMIRDGTYTSTLAEFIAHAAGGARRFDDQLLDLNNATGGREEYWQERKVESLMFEKVLTVSDVGRLNRLVIPKKEAIQHFPKPVEVDHTNSHNLTEEVELIFVDEVMKIWRFRYCYWKSSHSYVFTKGWTKFVKEKGLKPKDTILFYACDDDDNVMTDLNRSHEEANAAMIRIKRCSNTGLRDAALFEDEEEEEEPVMMADKMMINNKDVSAATAVASFRLFGVDIITN